jgi:hypothetical protein
VTEVFTSVTFSASIFQKEMTMPSFDESIETPDSARRKMATKFGQEVQRTDRNKPNNLPERITEKRCNVCTHPFRDWIEVMLVKGMPYKTLGERVSPTVHRHSIANHYNKHMDLQDTALRAILEQEAKLQGLNIEEGVGDIITKRGMLEVMARKGYEDAVTGHTTVEPRDMVQITKLLAEMDVQQYQIGIDEMRVQMQVFITAIKDVCDAEMQAAIGQRVKQLRTKDGVTAELESVMDDQVVEAEVID